MNFMNFEEWSALRESEGKPSSPRKMKKSDHKGKKSAKTREHEKDDLGPDYKGHIEDNGEVEPFKVK